MSATSEVQDYAPALERREAGDYLAASAWLKEWLTKHPQDAGAHAHLAHVLSLGNQDGAAIAAIEKALAIDSSLPLVQRNLARLQLKLRKTDDALKSAQAAMQSEPENPENQLVLAVVRSTKGGNALAMPLIDAALRVNPGYAEALAFRGIIKLQSGDRVAGLEDIESALAIKPHLPRMWGLAGSLRLQLNNLPGAMAAMETALEQDPENVEIMTVLGDIKRQAGQSDAALHLLERAVSLNPNNFAGWTNLGTALQQAQRIPEAINAYERSMAIKPDQAEVLHNLGALARSEGKWQAALDYFDRALGILPGHATFLVGKAAALNSLGRHEEAIATAREVARIAPDNVDGMLALAAGLSGMHRLEEALEVLKAAIPLCRERQSVCRHAIAMVAVCSALKLWAEAETWTRKALQIEPGNANLMNQLGKLLEEQLRHEEALAAFKSAFAVNPDNAATLEIIADHYAKREMWEEAEDWLRQAITHNPDKAELLVKLAATICQLRESDEAEKHLRQALEINPDLAAALVNLGSVLRGKEHFQEAETMLRRALALLPDSHEALCNLAAVLGDQGLRAEAETYYRQAISINPKCATPLVAMAKLQQDRGEFAQATALARQAIEVSPDESDAWALLAEVRKMTLSDRDWLIKPLEILDKRKLPPRKEANLHYAIGKYYNDIGSYDLAFGHYLEANRLKKSLRGNYQREAKTDAINKLMATYSRTVMTAERAGCSKAEFPVFILGMPRSGTSLVEQIIASHHQAFGAGEVRYWNTVATQNLRQLSDGQFEADLLASWALGYENCLREQAPAATRIVDKMPGNFMLLGLIHAVFPNARILHTTRHPIDNCLSIHFQNFTSGQEYANDLEDLAHYYREYHRLMAHWRSVLPADVFLDVPYEALVEDQEGWSRKIIDFIGLEWDERCLEFYKTDRNVGTASNWQVRQPVYKTSKERWRNYEQFVGPLLPLLELRTPNSSNP